MKYIPFIFLFTNVVFTQEYKKEIGVSNCTCNTTNLDSIITLNRSYYENGKRSSDVTVRIGANCEITDTLTRKYDTLGRLIEYSGTNFKTRFSFDSLDFITESVTIQNGERTNIKYEHIREHKKLIGVKIYNNGSLLSISTFKKRKEIVKDLEGQIVSVIRYNKRKQVVLHIVKKTTANNNKLIYKTKNHFNSNGDITKSINSRNGKKQLIIKTYYKGGREIKEKRVFCLENYTITTNYSYY